MVTPEQVFTPRAAEVNKTMYIERPELEERFKVALRGSLHLLIHGESGCGKSWLYKTILGESHLSYHPINLAVAATYGSIDSAMQDYVDRQGKATKVAYKETKSSEAGIPGFAKGELKHEGEYILGSKKPFEQCLQYCNSHSGGTDSFIVFDNLESIFNKNAIMDELGNLITLLDDEHFAKYKVRFILVGVPSEVREYYSKLPNRQTVANRIQELPEVATLDEEGVFNFVARGFLNELDYSVEHEALHTISRHVKWVTMGVPQRLHEYCLVVAQLSISSRQINIGVLDAADKRWLESQLSNDFALIQSMMNERDTKVGRRNQVLYSLGHVMTDGFRNSDIEGLVRQQFPTSTAKVAINVSQILDDLASRDCPIIKRSSTKTDVYMFSDPRYRMCIRAMLKKSADEKVYYFEIGTLLDRSSKS